jgi:hypothetical protein
MGVDILIDAGPAAATAGAASAPATAGASTALLSFVLAACLAWVGGASES